MGEDFLDEDENFSEPVAFKNPADLASREDPKPTHAPRRTA